MSEIWMFRIAHWTGIALNRLADSLSPYLLQHQDNPSTGFLGAKKHSSERGRLNRPIFLSVGYAACHWCHVMEHESFENDSIAAQLNEHFVSIKVDREERPDIDQIYMNAVQVMTGRGGWPMSVFLDHDLKPFFAGTYWPPTQKFGMPGFSQVLDALVDAWTNRRDEVEKHAGEITLALAAVGPGHERAVHESEQSSSVPDARLVHTATSHLLRRVGPRDGGFGGRPSFRMRPISICCSHAVGPRRTAGTDRSGRAHAGSHGGGRHSRPHRRWIRPLQRRCKVVGSAFRKNALRQRPAG